MAYTMQSYYGEVYTVPRFVDVEDTVASWTGPDRSKVIDNVELTEVQVGASIARLSENSASEPDGMPSLLV